MKKILSIFGCNKGRIKEVSTRPSIKGDKELPIAGENKQAENDKLYKKILSTAIITARNAPAHERMVTTLKNLNIEVDDVFFLGGIDKSRILNILKPHIFFDDQMVHLDHLENIPAVHIPFGIANNTQ